MDAKRKNNLSLAAVQVLCSYVSAHYDELFVKADKPKVKHRRDSAWDNAVAAVESQGFPPGRSGTELRLLWNTLSSRAKRYRDIRCMTGGGKRPHLSEKHEAVLEVLLQQTKCGIKPESAEAGLSIESLPSSQSTVKSENTAAAGILTEMMGASELECVMHQKPRKKTKKENRAYRVDEAENMLIKLESEKLSVMKEGLSLLKEGVSALKELVECLKNK